VGGRLPGSRDLSRPVRVRRAGGTGPGWGDPAYDRLIAESGARDRPRGASRGFSGGRALLLERGPVAPLYFGARSYLIRPSVKGWTPALLGYHRYAFVRLEE